MKLRLVSAVLATALLTLSLVLAAQNAPSSTETNSDQAAQTIPAEASTSQVTSTAPALELFENPLVPRPSYICPDPQCTTADDCYWYPGSYVYCVCNPHPCGGGVCACY